MDEFDKNFLAADDFDGEEERKTKEAAAATAVVSKALPIRRTHGFMDIYNSTSVIEWALEGLLPTKGLMYIGARSGTGKTLLAIQIAVDLILERDCMTLKRGKELPPQKILILSLEMGDEEIQDRIKNMYPTLTEEQQKILQDRIVVYSDPEPFKLWTPDHAIDLIRLIKHHEITGVLIDSASVSFASSLKDDIQVNASIDNLYMIRNRLHNWMIVVSHTRKLPPGIVGKMEDITVDELFGHAGVAQSASAVLIMAHDKKDKEGASGDFKIVWLMNLKARFGPEFPPFKMYLPTKPPLQFKRKAPIPLQPLTPEQKRAAKKAGEGLTFGDALKGIDFGLIGGIGDE